MSNLLFAEPLIIAQLQNYAPVTALVSAVDSMTDFDSVLQRAQLQSALFVGYAGEKITATYEDGKTQMVQQRWGVVVLVSTAKDLLGGKTVREKAGAIMAEVGNCLAGTILQDGVSALEQIDSPAPVYKAGKAFFFMMFGLNMARNFTR
jgi:hypothetical protein